MVHPTLKVRHIHLSRRLKLILAAGVVVAGTSSAVAFNTITNSQAGDTPVEVVVDDHEKRISKNETDIAETKDRVSGVEQKTDENTQAVREVEKQVVVVDGKAIAATSAAKQAQQAAQAAPAPQPAPVVKTVNPRLITGVSAVRQGDLWNCTYTLETGKTIYGYQGNPCGAVGTEISSDLAVMNGVQ